jgi:flagellar assembly protein FliH
METWNPSELSVELMAPAEETQKEHILHLFQIAEETVEKQDASFQAILGPRARDLNVTLWQPEDIELQPVFDESETWDFAPNSNDVEGVSEPEIPQDIVNPEEEALAVLTEASVQAEEIIRNARASADQMIQQGQEEIDQKKKQGYQQGLDKAHNELAEALEAAHVMVEEVRQWRDTLMAQGEQILVEMLKEIAQTMFGEGVRLDDSALQMNLNRVMENAQKLGDLNIFLSPRDAEHLDPSWSEYQLLITGNKVKIIPSEKIKPGGCLVKGSMGMIDGRVETQITAILNTIEETQGAVE